MLPDLSVLWVIAFVLLLIVAGVTAHRESRRERPSPRPRVALRVLLAVGALWVGLAVSVASLFSGI